MSGTLNQAVVEGQTSCKLYTNSSGNPAAITIHAQVLDDSQNVEFSAQYSSANICNTCTTQLSSASKPLNTFSGFACADSSGCFCGFHFINDTWDVLQNYCDVNTPSVVCAPIYCFTSGGQFVHVCVSDPTCAVACFGTVKPMSASQTLRTCRLCCMYLYSWGGYFDGQVSRNNRSPLVSSNGEDQKQYLITCCSYNSDATAYFEDKHLSFNRDAPNCNCYPAFNCLAGLHCCYIKQNFACDNTADVSCAFDHSGSMNDYDMYFYVQDIWATGSPLVAIRPNGPGSCSYHYTKINVPCLNSGDGGFCLCFGCGCLSQYIASTQFACLIMGCCYWCCCTCMCNNDVAKANYKPAMAGCGVMAFRSIAEAGTDQIYMFGYGPDDNDTWDTDTACMWCLIGTALGHGDSGNSDSCCKLRFSINMCGSCTSQSLKWLWYNPYDGKNYMHIIGSNDSRKGIYTVNKTAFPSRYNNTYVSCCICCMSIDDLLGGTYLTKVADNPSVFSGRNEFDIPTNPYLVGRSCWAIWWPCFCCNQDVGLWNGCWERYTSGDLMNWTKTDSDGVIATRGTSGTYPLSACIISTTTDGSTITSATNHYFNSACLDGSGTLEYKADINRLERTGIVIGNGDTLYVNNGSSSKVSVQVWGYDD